MGKDLNAGRNGELAHITIQSTVKDEKASGHNMTSLGWLAKLEKAIALGKTVQGWKDLGTKRSRKTGLLSEIWWDTVWRHLRIWRSGMKEQEIIVQNSSLALRTQA